MSNTRRARRRAAEPIMRVPAQNLAAALAGIPADSPTSAQITVSQFFGMLWQDEAAAAVTAMASLLVPSCRALGPQGAGPARAVASVAPASISDGLAAQAEGIPGELPGWARLLDKVALLDALSMDDPFGDQTIYMLKFGFRQGIAVIDPHVLWAVVDNNEWAVCEVDIYEPVAMELAIADRTAGMSTDVHPDLAVAAQRILDGMRTVEDDEEGVQHLSEETRDCWFLLASRVHACLPKPAPPPLPPRGEEREQLRARFMRSEALKPVLATEIDNEPARPKVIEAIAQVIIDFACDSARMRPDGWSPILVQDFFEFHAPDMPWHPVAIPWVGPTMTAYLGWVLGEPGELREAVLMEVEDSQGAFVEATLGPRQEKLARDLAVRIRVAGVDINDPDELAKFITDFNRSIGLD